MAKLFHTTDSEFEPSCGYPESLDDFGVAGRKLRVCFLMRKFSKCFIGQTCCVSDPVLSSNFLAARLIHDPNDVLFFRMPLQAVL